jgi:hypothetical protein
MSSGRHPPGRGQPRAAQANTALPQKVTPEYQAPAAPACWHSCWRAHLLVVEVHQAGGLVGGAADGQRRVCADMQAGEALRMEGVALEGRRTLPAAGSPHAQAAVGRARHNGLAWTEGEHRRIDGVPTKYQTLSDTQVQNCDSACLTFLQ